MSLPAPAYATTVSYTHPYATTPLYDGADAILVGTTDGSPTLSDYIIWDNLVERDQQAILDLVDRYGGTLPLASPVAASDSVDFGGAAGGDSTGLAQGQNYFKYYSATVYVDGVRYTDSWQGSELSTYTDIETVVSALVSGVATASLSGGVLTIESAGSPITDNSVTIQRGGTWNVFRNTADFSEWGTPLLAAVDARDVFERNQLPVNFARLP